MKAKFYLVIDQTAVWGYGKTKEAAIRDAEEWFPDRPGHIDDMLISKHESRNGSTGFYVEPCYFDLPDHVEDLSGDELYELYISHQS